MSKYAFLSKLPHKSTNISSTPPPEKNIKSENFDPKGTRNFCEYPPPPLSLEVIYIIHQLARVTIMPNCLIQLSFGPFLLYTFTPRNSHFLLFHMPVIMLNRLFRLPQTKSRVYSNRSFWTPRLHWFPAISVWLHGFWLRDFNTAKFWHVHQRFWQLQTDQSKYKLVVVLYIQCNTLMYGTVFSSAIGRLELYRTSGCCTRYTVLQL